MLQSNSTNLCAIMKSKYENDDIFFYFNIKYKLLNRYFKKIEIIALIMNNEKYKLLDHSIQYSIQIDEEEEGKKENDAQKG